MTRLIVALAAILAVPTAQAAERADPAVIIKAAIDYWRDVSSVSVFRMTIHRPAWERSMTMKVWTRGEKQSLVRVLSPPKDAGNATLLLENDMWTFNPKINRTIKIPSSMMNQSWMGSDFSNNDLAKADDLVTDYTHRLISTDTLEGHVIYVVESIPKEASPVPWGKEILTIRDDHVLLDHAFYDQEERLVKSLKVLELAPMGGKTVAARERMEKADIPEEWTMIETERAQFGTPLSDRIFTLSNLQAPRE